MFFRKNNRYSQSKNNQGDASNCIIFKYFFEIKKYNK